MVSCKNKNNNNNNTKKGKKRHSLPACYFFFFFNNEPQTIPLFNPYLHRPISFHSTWDSASDRHHLKTVIQVDQSNITEKKRSGK